MTLSEFKSRLSELKELKFHQEDGTAVPEHFHLTEVGVVNKQYVDCGGKERLENKISMQLWVASDVEHRLSPLKLMGILNAYAPLKDKGDSEIEVEYQRDTIGKYNLEYRNGHFVLGRTNTSCLAPDSCGLPLQKPKLKLSELQAQNQCCTPGSGCC